MMPEVAPRPAIGVALRLGTIAEEIPPTAGYAAVFLLS